MLKRSKQPAASAPVEIVFLENFSSEETDAIRDCAVEMGLTIDEFIRLVTAAHVHAKRRVRQFLPFRLGAVTSIDTDFPFFCAPVPVV